MKIISLDDVREPYRAPDLLWDGLTGDLGINALTHPTAPGDLRAEQGLATQVLICLMTDARVDDSELPAGVENRGWAGDSFDQAEGETPLGSRLWLLRNRSVLPGLEVEIEDYVREALQTLIDQGAVASVDVIVTLDAVRRRAEFVAKLHRKDGGLAYDGKFQLMWDQVNGVANPLRG